jgi:hypothetical protein
MEPIRNPRWEQKQTEGYVIVSSNRVFSPVTLQLGKPRLTGNFFIECMIISDFTFVNKCLYMYYISVNLSLNKLLNDI